MGSAIEGRVTIRPLRRFQPEKVAVDRGEQIVALELLPLVEPLQRKSGGAVAFGMESVRFPGRSPWRLKSANLPSNSWRPAFTATSGCATK